MTSFGSTVCSGCNPEDIPALAWGLVVTVFGVGLATIHALHLDQLQPPGTLVLGVLVPFGIAVGVVLPVGLLLLLPRDVYRQPRVDFLRRIGSWIAGWMVMGMVWMGIAGAGSITYQSATHLTEFEPLFLIAIFATYGALPGTITGYYYGRTAQTATEIAERERHLTVFMRVLRHNFRNQMNVLLGQLGLAEQRASQTPAKHINRAVTYGQDLMQTVEKQRFLVETVTDQKPSRVQAVPMIVESAVHTIRERYPEAEVRIEHQVDAAVVAHPEIDRALAELLENAIVHSERETPRAVLRMEGTTEAVSFSIHDSGAEIPPEETAILTRDTDPTQLEHGSGLGLWIVDRLLQQSGGCLDIEHGDTDGNTVVVRLPRHD